MQPTSRLILILVIIGIVVIIVIVLYGCCGTSSGSGSLASGSFASSNVSRGSS